MTKKKIFLIEDGKNKSSNIPYALQMEFVIDYEAMFDDGEISSLSQPPGVEKLIQETCNE